MQTACGKAASGMRWPFEASPGHQFSTSGGCSTLRPSGGRWSPGELAAVQADRALLLRERPVRLHLLSKNRAADTAPCQKQCSQVVTYVMVGRRASSLACGLLAKAVTQDSFTSAGYRALQPAPCGSSSSLSM